MNQQERERLHELLIDLMNTQASVTFARVMKNNDVRDRIIVLMNTRDEIFSFVESLTEK